RRAKGQPGACSVRCGRGRVRPGSRFGLPDEAFVIAFPLVLRFHRIDSRYGGSNGARNASRRRDPRPRHERVRPASSAARPEWIARASRRAVALRLLSVSLAPERETRVSAERRRRETSPWSRVLSSAKQKTATSY